MIILSHSCAKRSECEVVSIAMLRSLVSMRKYFATSRDDSVSSADVGSSARMSDLPVRPAMESIMRWRCPPEISFVFLFQSELSRPSNAQSEKSISVEKLMLRFTRSSKSEVTNFSTLSYGKERS